MLRNFTLNLQSATRSENSASEFLDEPLLGLFLADLLEVTEGSASGLSPVDSLASSAEHNVEVHSIDTGGGVILDSQVDVFFNTKPEVSYIIINIVEEKD